MPQERKIIFAREIYCNMTQGDTTLCLKQIKAARDFLMKNLLIKSKKPVQIEKESMEFSMLCLDTQTMLLFYLDGVPKFAT